MSMRIISKKALAIVLSVVMLFSCMVFSFSASAEETLMWENSFDNGTSSNWKMQYDGTASNHTSFHSDPSAATYGNYATLDNGAMKLGFGTNESAESYLSAFNVMHQETTHTNEGKYGWVDEYPGSLKAIGNFRPSDGKYKVTFDYTVTSFNQNSASKVALYVGYGETFWDGNRNLTYITNGGGVYKQVLTVDHLDIAAGKQQADVYLDVATTKTPYIFLFARVEDNTSADLTNAEIVVDNVKIYSVTADPVVLPSVLKYENNFDEGTATNWMSKYSDPNSAIILDAANGKAIYDATAKAMKIDLKKAGVISGFRMQHKAAAEDAFGTFTLGKGYYKIVLDYQLTAITDKAGAAVDICVGVAKKGTWYWEKSDKTLNYNGFTQGAREGVYEVAGTMTKSDLGAAMKTATVYLEITEAMGDRRMHIFTKAGDGYGDGLDSTVMVDNIKIYEVDKNALSTVTFFYDGGEVGTTSGVAGEAFVMPTLSGVPAECEYFSDAECTQQIELPTVYTAGTTNIYIKAKSAAPGEFVPILLYQNDFNNASDSNWKTILGNAASSLVSNGNNTKALYDDATKAMKIELNSPSYIAGFRMQNKDASNGADAQGNFAMGAGTYKIEIDYQLLGISPDEGAAVDVCVGFAKKGYWYWDNGSDKLRSRFEAADGGAGTYTVAATLTAADLGAPMGTKEFHVSLDDAFERRMHVFIKTGNGYGENPAATVLVDNIKVTTSNYTSVTFYKDGAVVGQSASGAPNSEFVMPTLTLPTGIPAGYKVAYYSDPELTAEIECPTVYPTESQKIYVKLVKAISDAWSFETEAINTKLSLNTRAENTIYTDNAVKHGGLASARVNSDAAEGTKNRYPQMLVKDGAGDHVFLEKGKNYEIKFWVYQPAANGNYALDYWFAVSGNDDVFDADDDAAHSRKHGLVAEGAFTPTATNAWQEITVVIADCAYGGKLRIGIIGDKDATHPFYIDDILVTEMSSETNVWSFDYLDVGTVLDVNTSDPGRTVTVDDFIKYSGYNSVRIDGNTKLRDYFPQMLIKNDEGKQIYVYEGRNYEIKFRLFKPDTQPAYDINYWLAATTEDVDKEFNRTDEGPDAYRAATYEVAGQSSVKITAGEWVEFVIPITNCKHTGKLRLGISGDYNSAHLFYIDDIVVNEFFLDPDSRMDSYERYESEQELALNTDGTSMKVLSEDRRSGDYAVKVVTTGNNIASAAQMPITNFRREPIKVEKGKDYRVSFWVERDGINADYDVQYWFAVGDDDTAFTTAIENVVVQPQTLDIEKSYVWYRVKATISDCPYSGTLRLGITGTSDESHTLYIDDMYAYEDTAGDPDPKAMNFEMYDVGTNLALNQYMPQSDYYKWTENTITVTDAESYTGGQSVFVHCNNNMQNNRPHMLVRDGSGNVIRVKKGDDFFLSFMMYVDPAAPYFSFGYWLTATPEQYDNTPFFGELSTNPEFSSPDYLLPGDRFEIMPPDAGVWTEIKIAVMDCPYEGSLRIGLCHGNAHPYESSFYIDDIKVYDPQYVTVKFNSNGSQDTYEDITLMSDMLIPMDNYIDPYREGYEFLGWYTSPTFEKETFFEIYTTPVTGKTGDVITLYARWREWDENVASGDRPRDEQKFETKTEYYTEEVWVENLDVPENPYPTEGSPLKDAAPIEVIPDDSAPEQGGMPPWLLVVIIVAAVLVVGGGSTLAAILLKKSKKA